jgi:hypothetical protein
MVDQPKQNQSQTNVQKPLDSSKKKDSSSNMQLIGIILLIMGLMFLGFAIFTW